MNDVYVLLIVFSDQVDPVRAFKTLHDACAFVARREGHDLVWTEHNSHGLCWSTPGYRIDQLPVDAGEDKRT